jgi:hypothetical protein
MGKTSSAWRSNIWSAHRIWGQLPSTAISALKQLTNNLAVSVAAGDLQFLENRWYVTHSGLLRIAQRRKCRGIETAIQDHLSDPRNNKWIIKATVFKSRNSRGFAGYGDADPTNVSSMVRGAELRIAETRAPESLRDRPLLGGGVGCVLESAEICLHPIGLEWVSSLKWSGQWPTAAPGSALPSDPPIQPRFEFGKGIRS